jgi:hypothetical protein
MTTANIDVRVNSQELENFIVNLNEADRELRAVAASADAVSSATSNFSSSMSGASNDIGALNTNVKALVSLQIGETFNTLAGTVEELGRHAGELEGYFREVAATTRNPLTRSLAEGAAATANFSQENSALLTSIFKVIAGVSSLAAVIVPKFAAISTAVAAFGATAANTLGPLTTLMYVYVGGTAAVVLSTLGVVAAIAGFAAVILWGSWKVIQLIAGLDDLSVAMRENIESVRDAQDGVTELNQAYVALTPQMRRLAELEEQVNAAREGSSQYMANVIADQAEVLGLYERQEEIAQLQLLRAEARNRWLGTEEAQLMINTMLQGDVLEADVARVMNLQAQERFNRLNTAELQEQLSILPALVDQTEAVVLSAEAHGRVLTRVSELAGAIVGFFQSSPAAEETGVGRTIGGIRREAEAAIVALNQLAGSNDAVFERLFADSEGLQLTPELSALYREATEEQRTFLLGLWEQQDDYLEAEAERRREAEEEERRQYEEHQAELARIQDEYAAYRARRQQEIIAANQTALEDSLEELLDPARQRLDLLFGGGDLDEIMEKQGKFSNNLVTNLLNMSDEGASALGVLNTAMQDMAAGFASSMGAALMSGDRVDKALKKALAGMLSSLGQTYLAQGAALLIPPPFNPLGNPAAGAVMMGIGGGMLGLSAAFGGIGMNASKKSPSTPAASTTPGSNQTQYTSVSFGFVGDRRAAGREVADVQENANRRGY